MPNFKTTFKINGTTLMKIAPHYSVNLANIDQNSEIIIELKGEFNFEPVLFKIDSCKATGATDEKKTEISIANTAAAEILNEIILMEMHTQYLHLNLHSLNIPNLATLSHVTFAADLIKKGIISTDTILVEDSEEQENFFALIDLYLDTYELGREDYISKRLSQEFERSQSSDLEEKYTEKEDKEDEKDEEEEDEDENENNDDSLEKQKTQAVRSACASLQIDLPKYSYKATQRSYTQHIYRTLSMQMTLNAIAGRTITFEDLVQHLQGHIAATREHHAKLGRFPFFRSLYNPHLVDVYEKALNILKNACPEEFAKLRYDNTKKPIFNTEAFQSTFKLPPSSILNNAEALTETYLERGIEIRDLQTQNNKKVP